MLKFIKDLTTVKKISYLCGTKLQSNNNKKKISKMKRFELQPTNGRKSFCGKAIVEIDEDGVETLYSYNTPICKRLQDGTIIRLYDGWTATTGNHIASFCGLNKKNFKNLKIQ